MDSVLSRYRTLIVLLGVLFLQFLGLAVQVRRTTDGESTRLIRVIVVKLVSPVESALINFQTSLSSGWRNYFDLRGVRQENRDLKAELDRLKLEQVRLSQDAEQAHRLQRLLAFKEQVISQTLAAQVIGTSGSELSRSVYIDRGAQDGVKPDMAVITADGVVGKVLRIFGSTSQVLLINDQSSGAGVILAKSRLQGVLRGTPNGELVVEKVMGDEQVPIGEQVMTSGGDGIYPKGMPVGTVTQVSPGAELFLTVKVKPVANLSKVEEVLVVTKKEDEAPSVDVSGPIRASDILSQRLPGVPQAPTTEVANGAAGKLPGPVGMGPNAAGAAATGQQPGAASAATGTGTATATAKTGGAAKTVIASPTPQAPGTGSPKPGAAKAAPATAKPAPAQQDSARNSPRPPSQDTPR
jgi:rod shape-determining protein MreC